MANTRRAGDENIGKLIVFAITIVIAIGLVGLVSYFYTQSREASINVAILGSTSSTAAELAKVKTTAGAVISTTCSATGTTVKYEALSDEYYLSNGTGAIVCTDLANVKGVSNYNTTTNKYTLAK